MAMKGWSGLRLRRPADGPAGARMSMPPSTARSRRGPNLPRIRSSSRQMPARWSPPRSALPAPKSTSSPKRNDPQFSGTPPAGWSRERRRCCVVGRWTWLRTSGGRSQLETGRHRPRRLSGRLMRWPPDRSRTGRLIALAALAAALLKARPPWRCGSGGPAFPSGAVPNADLTPVAFRRPAGLGRRRPGRRARHLRASCPGISPIPAVSLRPRRGCRLAGGLHGGARTAPPWPPLLRGPFRRLRGVGVRQRRRQDHRYYEARTGRSRTAGRCCSPNPHMASRPIW